LEVERQRFEAERLKFEAERKRKEAEERVKHEEQQPERKQVFLSGVVRGKLLGEGSFGQVYGGKWIGTDVAIKTLKGDKVAGDFEKEIQTFQYESNGWMYL
jgi:hypothetical protein